MLFHLFGGKKWGSQKNHSHRVAFNLAALFVIVITIIAPLEPAFAQSTDASATANSDAATSGTSALGTGENNTGSPTVSPSTTENTPTQENTATPTTVDQSGTSDATAPSSQTSGVTQSPEQSATPAAAPSAPPPTAPPPSGPSTGPDLQPLVYNSFNQSQVKIDKNTGALDTAYPISIPPGRNGLQPDLDLVYNSQNSQQGSVFGEGWGISIPYIERLNKSGVDNLYSTSTLNYFTSSFDGELVATTTVTSTASGYIARTENGAFNKYTYASSTNEWTMIDKNGTQYVFGSSTDALQNDPNNSSHVYKWMLKTVTDTNSNTVTYNYTKDSVQIYPSSTLYTGNGSSTGIFEVDFKLATTTSIDNSTSSATGFAVNSNYRVSEIDAKVNGTWVRKYVLGYTTGDNGYTTLLGSIAESGENASGTVTSLPSSTFNYQLQTPGWTSSSTWNPPTPFVSSSSADDGVRIPNLTGNGLPGLITNSNAWVDTGNSWQSSSTWVSPVAFTTGNGGDNGYRVADVTGNSLADIISCNGSYINTGSGWVSSSSWNSPVCFANNGVSTGAILADVNGDGLPAILYGSASSTATTTKVFQVDTNGTLDTSLISYYKLEDATDFYSSHNLTNNNSVTFDAGKVNDGSDFGSANTNEDLSIGSNLGVTGGPFSFSGWVNVTTAPTSGNQMFLFGISDGGTNTEYHIAYQNNGGTLQLLFARNRQGIAADGPLVTQTLTTGTWYQIAVTYDGTNVRGYLNGSLIGGPTSASGNGTGTSPTNLVLGASENINAFLSGHLDEVGVWSKALSSQEITDLYNSGSGQTMEINNNASTTSAAYLDTGTGWATSTIWAPPTAFVGSGGIDVGTRIADVNGDGLPDIIQGYTDAASVFHQVAYLNTGMGWATSTVWDPPVPFTSTNGWDNGYRIADVNGDVLPDIVQSYTDVSGNPTSTAYLNTGHGWTSDAVWDPPTVFSSNGGYDQGARITDVLGDGLPSIVSGYTDFSNNNHYAAWVNDNTTRADVLTSITYPQGGSTAIQYAVASQFMNASGTVANNVPYPVYVVSKITTSDGSGHTASALSYQYSGGTYYYNTPFDHQFAGFSLVTQTDAAGSVTKTYYDTSNGVSSSTGQYADNFWKIGKPYRVENYDNASNLYKVTVTKWDSTSTAGIAGFVFPDQTLEMDYDGLSTHADSAEAYTYNVANGNQTQKLQYGQVIGSTNGTFTTISTSTDEFTTNYSYASSTTSSVIGKSSDEILLNQSSTKIQETQYYYDNLGLGSVGAGNLTKQEDWKSASTYVNTVQNTYNGYGLITQSLDPRNNTTTFTYDSFNLYPATTTNALSQATGYQYDYSTGKPTQTIDPNRLMFQTSYDGLGRTLQVQQPDQTVTSTLDLKIAYTYTDTANAVSAHESDYLTATTTVDTYTYYDGLNRPIQTRKSATDAGVYRVSDQVYNNIGSVQKASLPYFASSSAQSTATTTTALFAIYAYDPLGRVLTTATAVGTTTNVYANWKTTTTDPNGDAKDTYDDAYGNLIQVGEHNGSSTYTTTYSYDGLKDLLNLTDANGNVRNFVYDGLGRMVSSTDLHAPTSSTYGIWNFTYDDAGNLTTKVDPKSQSITYAYDGLNRVMSESLGGAPQIAYTYDSCTNGIGRLCTVSSTDAVALTTKTYDPEGNLASETKKIDATNYLTSYTYDRQGNQLTITNPDISIVQFVYGTAGLVTSIQEEEPSSTFNTLVSSIDYSPMDKMTTQTNANGVTTVNTYDPTRLYRLISTVTTDNGSGFGQMAPLGGGGGGGHFGPLPPSGGGTTFSCTGAETTYTVPANVTKLFIDAFGAQGGLSGGLGGEASGTLAVTSGTTYYINVGCQNGYDGGGSGGSSSDGGQSGGSGGGMTWISANSAFTTSTVLMVAGGGGSTGGQGTAGTGSPGSGGTGGGTSGGSGGTGSSSYCSSDLCAGGGSGGSQSVGGSGGSPAGEQAYVGVNGGVGYGGFGGNSNIYGGGGGGGGGGYYGGGGGAGNGVDVDGFMGGGGGGGSSYVTASSFLTNTAIVSGVNSGDGYLTISTLNTSLGLAIASSGQYLLNGITPLGEGSSTTQGGVILGGTLNSNGTTTLQLQVEVEPAGTSFTNVPNVTSSIFVVSSTVATTTFFGPSNSYHWQARVRDANNNTSTWQLFGPSTTSTDFILLTSVPEYYTGSVASFTVPAHVIGLTLNAYGAQGASSGGLGGEMVGTLSVTSGTTYYFNIGGQNGYGGGGSGGSFFCGGSTAAAGGGMTWFSNSSTFNPSSSVLLIAGGGGGSGLAAPACGNSETGGIGGGSSGGNGSGSSGQSGTGGTQSSGGSGGSSGNGVAGTGGSVGQGGAGGYSLTTGTTGGDGGGGGGGLYGGGGGGGGAYGLTDGGGGGGASSYASSIFTATSTTSGANATSGTMLIIETFTPVPSVSSSVQYLADGVTNLHEGSSTNKGTVVLGATLNSYIASNIQLQVEVEPTGTVFTNIPNVTSSNFVASGNVATTSFTAVNGGYHWQARAIDAANNTSTWQLFGPTTTSTDFVIAVPHINFTFPTQGTSTPNFSNWQLKADTVTSTDSYSLTVNWDDLTGDPMQSSTIAASGTQLLSGVNVSKQVFSGDYTYDGTPVTMNASATLYDAAAVSATNAISFTEVTTSTPLNCGSHQIQCISYTYDNDGNVTQVADNSATNAAITVNYTYDSLNRVLTASSSNAVSGQNYLQTFSYDPVGNLLSGPQGTYSYAGTNYTDRDAVTSIVNGTSTTSFTYDNNGNLTNASSGFNYTWNYRNDLISATSTNSTSTYGYDSTDQRVKVVTGGVTTYYPETTYSVNATTKSKHIFADGFLMATIQNSSSTGGGGSLLLDATSTSGDKSGAISVVNWNHAVTSTANPILLVAMDVGGATTTAVTYGGVSLTRVADKKNTSASIDDVSIWYLLNPSSGAHNISSTLSGSPTTHAIGYALSLTGENQSAPFDSTSTNSGTATTATDTIKTTVNGDWYLSIVANSGNTAPTANSAQKIISSDSQTSNRNIAGYLSLGNVIGTTSSTWSVGSSPNWAQADAVIQPSSGGSAATTTIDYASDDDLGGTNVVTNTSGTLIETLQYYPYGSIRIDNTAGSYTGEVRKYIGQQYDAATSLSYLNARYYSGAQGQFLSEDPVFLGVPSQQHLSTPQSLNAYSYAEDNPTSQSDATGKYVEEISQPIIIDGYNIGYNHAFLYVVPEPGENLPALSSNNSTIDTSQPFTLSGEPSALWGGTLNFIANNPYDYGIASNQASVPGVARVRVGPPNGMTSSRFDASVVSSFNNLSQEQWVYNYIGSRQVTGGGNSNNANTTLLENAGVTSRQMNSIQMQMASQGAHGAPGLGGSLNSPTPLQTTLSALSSALSSLSSLLARL